MKKIYKAQREKKLILWNKIKNKQLKQEVNLHYQIDICVSLFFKMKSTIKLIMSNKITYATK